tara:strand:+ start:2138 stop:2344 length:207 start_codon:yes stop_codon:yes gene_type:complete
MKLTALVVLLAALVACTHEQVYNNVQHNQQLECSKLPQVRFEECMKNYDQSYEDYERERQAIIDKDTN